MAKTPNRDREREDQSTDALVRKLARAILAEQEAQGEPDDDEGENRVEMEPEPFVDAAEYEDRRNRSRKVYMLSAGATDRSNKIPDRPTSARRTFRYLQKYEVGTVKQIAHALNLEKKTIGNGLAALKQVGLVDAVELPKNG